MSCYSCGKHECHAGRFCGSNGYDLALKPALVDQSKPIKTSCSVCGGTGPDFVWNHEAKVSVCFECNVKAVRVLDVMELG